MIEFFWYVGGIVFILLGIGFSIGIPVICQELIDCQQDSELLWQ